ncbi:MAG: hypothetical protein U9R19_04765 [Bacteroidota bacterium]|nr:hypothetical protein [Bacteroidota bacterium]
MDIGKDYQVNMNAESYIIVTGVQIKPETTTIYLPQGWSILGYLRDTPGEIDDIFSSIVNDIIIVKDEHGNLYWPQYGVNTIGFMKPGEGYQIRMLQTDTLTYPPN